MRDFSELGRLQDRVTEELQTHSTYTHVTMTDGMREILVRTNPDIFKKAAKAKKLAARRNAIAARTPAPHAENASLPPTVRCSDMALVIPKIKMEKMAKRAVRNFIRLGWSFTKSAMQARMDPYDFRKLMQRFRDQPWYESRNSGHVKGNLK